MFNAYSKDKEVVTLLNLTRGEIEKMKGESYFCPACNHPVRIKNGTVKLPHFAHHNQSSCTLYTEGETIEHLALKEVFARWCEKESIHYELEKYLPELNQRPDLLIGNIALEIQCSPISVQRLVERTKSYQKHGYTPIWICGSKLFSNHQTLSELVKNLCYYSEQLGFYFWSADWQNKELNIYFHIEEDWKKRIYFSKKTWAFYNDLLIEILNFPSNSHMYVQRKFNIGELIQEYYRALSKKLYKRDEQIRMIQSVLYNKRFHLLYLPTWFYYPGLHLFCCRGSDLLLKLQIWEWVQFFDQNVFELEDLFLHLNNKLEQSLELFYELPNVPINVVKKYCINQVLMNLLACNHLVRSQSKWQVLANTTERSIADVEQWLKRIENKCLITATPFKNVIR